MATVVAILLLVLVVAVQPSAARADEGWVIDQFVSKISVETNGIVDVVETIQVDFGSQQKHGIFRNIPVRYSYDQQNVRVYDLSVESVTDGSGRGIRYAVSSSGADEVLKIGDPNRTISGRQTYVIHYRVQGALNSFSDHDELYWNATGEWPVRILRASATVTLPGDTEVQNACYQGETGSKETCQSSATSDGATYQTTRALPENQQMTIVTGWDKGLVAEPQPILQPVGKAPSEGQVDGVQVGSREVVSFFDVTPATVGGGGAVLVAVLGAIGYGWWRFGRDRQFATIRYLDESSPEQTRPLFSGEPIVVEYAPPDKLRPAQLGVIVDESADPLDVTATIVDLAVRGYLTITEVEKQGIIAAIIGGRDWELARTNKPTADLFEYEREILSGLFSLGSPVRLEDLRQHFYKYLQRAQKYLYQDAMSRKWFAFRPDYARAAWLIGGIALAVVGFFAMMGLGGAYGAGLVGAPLVLGGIVLAAISGAMPKRTAVGRDMLRRTLGFREYISTAEKDRQRFNEQINLFSEYLPYAVVFGCVDKWARAFENLGEEATRGWYYGPTYFSAVDFSRNLQSFSSAVSTTVVSTPGGSGSSGFSSGGGFSGGGGGGGGGGSW